jgi:Flp pilus assembly protein CpaB
MTNAKVALAVAAVLGIAGAVLNLMYLQEKAGNFEKVEFIGVAQGATIMPGDRFTKEKLVPVPVPKAALGELPEHAMLWSDLQTVIGMPALKAYTRGELILRSDLRTPPAALALTREDERAIFIPVDTRTFVPALVTPGDLVSFYVADSPTPAATPDPGGDSVLTDSEGLQPTPTPRPGTKAEVIGPFRVLSLGNRLGSADVHKASGISQLQENVISIAVKFQGDQFEPKADKLLKRLQSSGFRQAGVVLHPRK